MITLGYCEAEVRSVLEVAVAATIAVCAAGVHESCAKPATCLSVIAESEAVFETIRCRDHSARSACEVTAAAKLIRDAIVVDNIRPIIPRAASIDQAYWPRCWGSGAGACGGCLHVR